MWWKKVETGTVTHISFSTGWKCLPAPRPGRWSGTLFQVWIWNREHVSDRPLSRSSPVSSSSLLTPWIPITSPCLYSGLSEALLGTTVGQTWCSVPSDRIMQNVCCSVLDTLAQRLVLPCLSGFGGARHHIVSSSVESPCACGWRGTFWGLLSLLQMRLRLCLAAGLTSS